MERAEREQYYAKPFGGGSEHRDKQPDPNSPFAKLAALKQQLEQNTKDLKRMIPKSGYRFSGKIMRQL